MDWTLRRLLDDAGVPAVMRADARITGVTHVHSQVGEGDLFCCIPGRSFDGHAFAPDAVRAGAAALLVERDLELDVPQARVGSVRSAIGPLAASFYGRPSERMRVVGVTGTKGKTTTTYVVESIAEAAGVQAGVLGTNECRTRDVRWPTLLGTPEAPLLQHRLSEMAGASAAVVAMEVTSIGLDKRRVDGTRFACVAFTNLGRDHLDEYHGTMDAYFEAKASLFRSRFAPAATVNVDTEHGSRLAARCRPELELLACSSRGGAGADVVAERTELSLDGTRFTARTPIGDVEVVSGLVGAYNVDNLLLATGIAIHLGLPLDAIAAGTRELPRLRGRFERVDEGQRFMVVVDYAHTPGSLEAVLSAVRGSRVIVVFGCGGDRDLGKRPLMGEIATRLADLTVLTSDNPRTEDPMKVIGDIQTGARRGGGEYVVEPDRRRAIARAIGAARDGDIVVIAGKGHEQGQTFADRTVPFDDREVARELLREVACPSD